MVLIKLFLSLLLLLFVSCFGLFYQLSMIEEKQSKVVEDNLLKTSQLIARKVDNWIDRNLHNSAMLTQLEDIKAMDPERQEPILSAVTQVLEQSSVIFITDTSGNAIARSDGKKLRNYSDREYFKQILNGKNVSQQVLVGEENLHLLYCLAMPITDLELLGIVTQCSALTNITDFIVKQRVGVTGLAFLVDDDNRLIAHGNVQNVAAQLQDFGGHPAIKEIGNDDINIVDVDGEKHIFVVAEVGLGWKLIVQQDYDEAYADYIALKKITRYTIAAMVMLIIALAIFMRINVILPIKKLTQIANELSRGRLTEPVEYTSRYDEVGELATAIEKMGVSIRLVLKQLKLSSDKAEKQQSITT